MSSITDTLLTNQSPSESIRLTAAYDNKTHEGYKYAEYLPVHDETTTIPPVEPFAFHDRGLDADKAKPNLLNHPGISLTRLTPRIGTEISGLQLSELTDAQKNELALLVAERGVVVFRDQDFKDIGAQRQKEFAQYFGKLHVHPTGAHVKGHLEYHNIYLGSDNLHRAQAHSTKLSTVGYHSDVPYERQPPGLTLLTLLSVSASGGDTAWVSQAAAYERLSEPIKRLLGGLEAEHDGFRQAENARRDGKFVRREPVRNNHPIVRVHPMSCYAYLNRYISKIDSWQVTGERALYINPDFTRRIIVLKDEESDALLKLLFNHISVAADLQVRVKRDDRTVSIWDNRVTSHTAISDYNVHDIEEGLRHGVRLTTLAEEPVGVHG